MISLSTPFLLSSYIKWQNPTNGFEEGERDLDCPKIIELTARIKVWWIAPCFPVHLHFSISSTSSLSSSVFSYSASSKVRENTLPSIQKNAYWSVFRLISLDINSLHCLIKPFHHLSLIIQLNMYLWSEFSLYTFYILFYATSGIINKPMLLHLKPKSMGF